MTNNSKCTTSVFFAVPRMETSHHQIWQDRWPGWRANRVHPLGESWRVRDFLELLEDKFVSRNKSILKGLLRVGYKTLYLTDNEQNQYMEKAMCILDFFVVATEQRSGNGFKMFDAMLKVRNKVSRERWYFQQWETKCNRSDVQETYIWPVFRISFFFVLKYTKFQAENVSVEECAFDKPSTALQHFIEKYYNQKDPGKKLQEKHLGELFLR